MQYSALMEGLTSHMTGELHHRMHYPSRSFAEFHIRDHSFYTIYIVYTSNPLSGTLNSRHQHVVSQWGIPPCCVGSDVAKWRQDDLCCRRTIRRWNPELASFPVMYGSVGAEELFRIHTSAKSKWTVRCSAPPNETFCVECGIPVPYINGNLSSRRFHRCTVRLQQSSFSPHFDSSLFRMSDIAPLIIL